MSRLKGPRLENEVEKCRGECNWKRLEELLAFCKSKGSGMEFLVNFLTGEVQLERFVDDKCNSTDGLLSPRADYKNALRDANGALQHVLTNISDYKPYVILETHLLLAKLNYVCSDFQGAIDSVNSSQLDRQDIQFQTLRTLRLVAEAYAIKGLAMEKLSPGSGGGTARLSGRGIGGTARNLDTQTLYCFEKAADLALAYIQELEKSSDDRATAHGLSVSTGTTVNVSGAQAATPVATGATPFPATSRVGTDKIGEFMETAIQRVPLMQLKQTPQQQIQQQRTLEKGVEYYRRILTAIGDKSVAQHLHQKLSRQLAEVLLRGVPEASYSPATKSTAVAQKAQHLRFYMGSERGYYSPENRLEEVLLVLSISEALAAREAILSRADENRTLRDDSLMNVKAVQNLLTLVLSSIRQYQLIAGLFEKAMKFAYEDRYIWYQFALSLISYGKVSRAALILKECIEQMPSEDQDPVQLIFAAKLAIEHLANYDEGASYARAAIAACNNGWLSTRAYLMLGMALSLKAQMGASHSIRRNTQRDAVEAFEAAVRADIKDALAPFFLALQHAICRDVSSAREFCEKSLDIDPEQPFALMLLALLLTAENSYTEAYEVVREAMDEFPNHYGLMVLRLKLEIHYGRSDAALATARELLMFWKSTEASNQVNVPVATSSAAPSMAADRITTTQAAPVMNYGGDSRSGLMSPSNTGTLRSTSSLHLHAAGSAGMTLSSSTMDITDKESLLAGAGGAMSEYGGAASTVSDSLGLTTGSSYQSLHNKWRRQANIWLELAELFLDAGKLQDVHKCVDEACQLFPNSHQTLYLKGRVLVLKAAECAEPSAVERLLNEAKACFLGSLSILPNHIPSLRQLTAVYQAEGNLKMAEKVLRDLIKIEPLDHETWQKLGQVLAEERRFEEAAECFATATNLEDTAPIMPFTVIPRVLHL